MRLYNQADFEKAGHTYGKLMPEQIGEWVTIDAVVVDDSMVAHDDG